MSATQKHIETAQRQYASIDFEVTGENLEGLGIRWVLAQSEHDAPLELKTEADMVVSGDTATLNLSTSETDRAGRHYYEFWVEWQPGQWVKQFKGNHTFEISTDYTNN